MFAVSTIILCLLVVGQLHADSKEDHSNSNVLPSVDYQELVKRGSGNHKKLKIARDLSYGTGRARLGFFTPVYCKRFEQWIKNRKYGLGICHQRNRDCDEIFHCYSKHGRKAKSGVYWIKPKHYKPIQVYCDMHTHGGGWTVFQHRMDGSENFFRTWSEYKKGFGNLRREFWLGNDNIHAIVSQGKYSLRVNLQDYAGNKRFAFYNNFYIGNEKHKYKLTVGGYSGNAGDSLKHHNNYNFSTKDRDNDVWSKNCAVRFTGAWWYVACHASNLNGLYYRQKTTDDKYNRWHSWPGGTTNIKTSLMAVRRVPRPKN